MIQGSFSAQPRPSGRHPYAMQLPETHPLFRSRPIGQPLPDGLRRGMEAAFGADLSQVRIHQGIHARSLGAIAFTCGSEIHFAPGHYRPTDPGGQRLLAHELAHAVQQRSGRVPNPFGRGIAVVRQPGLEAEAERLALQAVRFLASETAAGRATPSPAAGRLQRSGDHRRPFPTARHPGPPAASRTAGPARHVQAALRRTGWEGRAPAAAPQVPGVPLQRRPAPRPGAVQMYNLKKVYERARLKTSPPEEILDDLQIIHDTLNRSESFDLYLQMLDNLVKWQMGRGLRPTDALSRAIGVADLEGRPLLKLYETVPGEPEFLGVIGQEVQPFHDISAGLFHGEYGHRMQLDFVKFMYKNKDLYGLKKTFGAVWAAMFNPEYVIKEGEVHLSLWSLVLDIQGKFLTGGLPGVRVFEQSYEGVYGTSATLLHHGFGAWGSKTIYEGMSYGELAKKFPYLAAAILDRAEKRKEESAKPKGKPVSFPKYYSKIHWEERRKMERQETVRSKLEGFGVSIPEWQVKPSRPTEPVEKRRNVYK